jgi:hypothetical protein
LPIGIADYRLGLPIGIADWDCPSPTGIVDCRLELLIGDRVGLSRGVAHQSIFGILKIANPQ